MRISELVEKFPKLSGLDGLIVKDLKKKTERGFVPVKSDGLIGDNIQAKDVLSFDLVFSKIWLEVEMDIRTEDKSVNIAFELDVKVDMFISDLKKILIKMGMEYWAEYSKNLNVEFDYYLFSEFTIERNGVDLSNKQGEDEVINFRKDRLFP